MPIRFHLAAEEELHEVQRYYEAKQPGLGNAWLDAVEGATRQLQGKPTSGRPTRYGTRKYRLVRFPYYLIFMARDVDLFIVSIMHVKRHPDYWATRL